MKLYHLNNALIVYSVCHPYYVLMNSTFTTADSQDEAPSHTFAHLYNLFSYLSIKNIDDANMDSFSNGLLYLMFACAQTCFTVSLTELKYFLLGF